VSPRLPFLGGSRNNSSNAGLGAVNLNNTRANANNNIGAASDYLLGTKRDTQGWRDSLQKEDKEPSSFSAWEKHVTRRGRPVAKAIVAPDHFLGSNMPRTFNDLWATLVSFENLYISYLNVRKKHREHMEVYKFEKVLEENLITIQNELIWHTWNPQQPKRFVVYEPKKRAIEAPTFRDRVVHQAYYQIVGPLMEHKYIGNTYACIKDRGTLGAVQCVHSFIKSYPKDKKLMAIYGDMSGYFPSICHEYLKQQVRKTIQDPDVLWLGDKLIDANGAEIGLGIGSLPSQLYAGLNLDRFDHYMKDDLGVRHYARYMDDWVVISDDKTYLREILRLAIRFLEGDPCLRINPKSGIIPISHGLDFCGYRIFRHYLLPRKRNVRKAKNALTFLSSKVNEGVVPYDKFRSTLMSFIGYMKHCRGSRTVDSVLSNITIRNHEANNENTIYLLRRQTTTGSSHPSYDSGAQALL